MHYENNLANIPLGRQLPALWHPHECSYNVNVVTSCLAASGSPCLVHSKHGPSTLCYSGGSQLAGGCECHSHPARVVGGGLDYWSMVIAAVSRTPRQWVRKHSVATLGAVTFDCYLFQILLRCLSPTTMEFNCNSPDALLYLLLCRLVPYAPCLLVVLTFFLHCPRHSSVPGKCRISYHQRHQRNSIHHLVRFKHKMHSLLTSSLNHLTLPKHTLCRFIYIVRV